MTSLPQLDGPAVPPHSGGRPRQLVILIHGYGSNGDDLIGLVPYWTAALPDALWLSPNAPERCPGTPNGYQWWPLLTMSAQERSAGAQRAGPVLDAFIDQQLERHGLTEADLALVGFSQGTMMALHVGPRREKQIAGILGFSGMLTDEISLEAEGRTKPPVLLIHGDMDPVLPIQSFHHASHHLDRLGYELQTHVCQGMGHSIDATGLKLGLEFLKNVFNL